MQEKASATNQEQSAVTLMTLHAAKGLEFDIVIVAGVEEGILPSTRALNDTAALEEERRLFYVGITRARERLILSHSRYRYAYGRMTDQMPSRFLEEIPQSLQNAHDLRNKEAATQRLFAQWLGAAPAESQVFTFATATAAPKRPLVVRHAVKSVKVATPPPASSLSKTTSQSPYRLYQSVQHAKYGVGIVQKIEPQDNGTTYITAQFKVGSKKILDSFLQIV
jgi:DNA helicase-2/ATP-dependent DNA helicase PcrA